jgi:hypothetical protein
LLRDESKNLAMIYVAFEYEITLRAFIVVTVVFGNRIDG